MKLLAAFTQEDQSNIRRSLLRAKHSILEAMDSNANYDDVRILNEYIEKAIAELQSAHDVTKHFEPNLNK
jgi:guanylate kinase